MCIEKHCFICTIGDGWVRMRRELGGIGRELSGVSEKDCLTDSPDIGWQRQEVVRTIYLLEERLVNFFC